MSRIEQALEKAASSRGVKTHNSPSTEVVVAAGKQPPLQSSPPKPDFDKLLETPQININNPMLVAIGDNKSIASEEYNKLRSLIVELTHGKEFHNTLLISSSITEEGKSLTALNLAIALAKGYDHTVLLVDTDLRRPSLHKLLGIKPEVGLIQCLRDNIPLSQALIKTGIGKLVFLPAGGTVSKPVELLSSNRMKEVVRELKNRYPERYVIFDTPPVLPFADAQVLAPTVDGVLFIVREGRAKAHEIQKALQTLQGTNLLGTVYNDAHNYIKKRSYYYYQ